MTSPTAPAHATEAARRLAICAEALRAARSLRALTTGLSIVAAAGLALAGLLSGLAAISFWTAALGAGAVAQWVGFRIAFDAALFARLADEARRGLLDLDRFDAAMRTLRLMPAAKAGRDIDTRCRGALRLLHAMGVVVVMQIVFVVIAAPQLHEG